MRISWTNKEFDIINALCNHEDYCLFIVVGINIVNQFTAQIVDNVKFGTHFMLLEANPAP